jgi:hypothetical protein
LASVTLLLEDHAPEVRVAAAWAGFLLGTGHAHRALELHTRTERDPVVSSALRRALSTPRRSLSEAIGRGREALIARLRSDSPQLIVPVDIVLTDGRWIRMTTLPTGEIILVDLPSGIADVRVQL